MKIEQTFLKTNYTHQELINIFETINFKLLKLVEFSKMDILPASRLIKHHDALIKALLKTVAGTQLLQLNSFCEENIRLVVTHLQVQDMMSQTFDHMQQINTNIILELKAVPADIDAKEGISTLPLDSKFLCVLPEIISMTKDQLNLIGIEYEKTTSSVTYILDLMEKEIKSISSHDLELMIAFPNTALFYSELDKIQFELSDLEQKTTVENMDRKEMNTKMLEVGSIFTTENERKILNKILCGIELSSQENISNADDEVELF